MAISKGVYLKPYSPQDQSEDLETLPQYPLNDFKSQSRWTYHQDIGVLSTASDARHGPVPLWTVESVYSGNELNQCPRNNASSKFSRVRQFKHKQVLSVLSCFMANCFLGAVVTVYGVLYTYITDSVDVTEKQLSWISSLSTGSIGISAVPAAMLVQNVGPRITALAGALLLGPSVAISSQTSNIFILYITLGVLAGSGVALILMGTTIDVSTQFDKWRPVAIGISVTGYALGSFVYPVVTSSLAEAYAWQGALLVIGGSLLNMVPASLLLRPQKEDKERTAQQKISTAGIYRGIKNYLNVFKIPKIIPFAIASTTTGLVGYAFGIFTPDYVASSVPGATRADGALVLSLAGAGNLVSKFIFSVLAMLHPKLAVHIYFWSFVADGVLMMALTWCGLVGSMVVGTLHGIALGGWTGFYSLTFISVFGLENLANILGTYSWVQGIGAICGPPFLSYLAHIAGSKDIIFYVTGALFIMFAVAICPILFGTNLRGAKKVQHKSSDNQTSISIAISP